MKTNYFYRIGLCILLFLLTSLLYGQNTCTSPVNIATLPYALASGTTCGTGNDYTSTSVPAGGTGAYLGGEDRVYKFTPTATGTVTITITQPTGAWLGVFVYTGCPFTSYIGGIQNNVVTKSVVVNVTSGVSYYVVLDTWPSPTCTSFSGFSISAVTPVYNPCTSVSTISGCGVPVSAIVTSGTGAYNPVGGTCGFSTPGKEIIYQFTPGVTGMYSINQTSSFGYIDYFFKPISTGCSGTGWTCIDDLTGAMSSVTFSLTAGVTYYIMLDPEVSTGGTVNFSISCPVSAPVNDNCANAISIALPFLSAVTSTAGSTTDVPLTSSCGTQANNVWYKTMGTGNTISATTCFLETNFDTEIRVYSGLCGSMSELSCNDDDGSCGISGLNSTVSFCSMAGVEYYFSVGYWTDGTTTGNFKLSITDGVACSVLPIELLSFNAVEDRNQVKINWTTMTEINNDYFIIEKSQDGIHYTLLETVSGAGNSSVSISYSILDINPYQGLNYYRLSQTDFNGQVQFFSPVAVRLNAISCDNPVYYDILGNRVEWNQIASGVYLKNCNGTIEKKWRLKE